MLKLSSENRRKWRLTFILLYRIIFVSIVATMTAFLVTFVVVRIAKFPQRQVVGFIFSIIWYLVCIIISNIFIYNLMRGTTMVVDKLSDATKKVAKGDFTVRLDEKNRMNMVHELYADFNSMVKALGTIETLQNGFVADVSHEFKTPIAAIEGYAQLLQDENLSDEERQTYIESIIYNSRRLSNLTGNILMISKLDNSTVKVKYSMFRLDEQIRRIILNFEDKWDEKNLELDIDLDPVKYYGDEDLLYNVWLNLISNAIKFSNNDGLLSIKLINNKYNVVVKVSDNGVGMSPDELERIYDKFYQSDSSRTQEGNGLGLALVKRILDVCNAKIEVKSEVGKGTEFTVTLPVE